MLHRKFVICVRDANAQKIDIRIIYREHFKSQRKFCGTLMRASERAYGPKCFLVRHRRHRRRRRRHHRPYTQNPQWQFIWPIENRSFCENLM